MYLLLPHPLLICYEDFLARIIRNYLFLVEIVLENFIELLRSNNFTPAKK